MRRQAGFALLVFGILAVALYGLMRSAATYSGFWSAFMPSVWANLIGVSVAAIIGIPIGILINQYFLGLAVEESRRKKVAQVRDLLELVRQEVDLHSGQLQRLGQFFPSQRFSMSLADLF